MPEYIGLSANGAEDIRVIHCFAILIPVDFSANMISSRSGSSTNGKLSNWVHLGGFCPSQSLLGHSAQVGESRPPSLPLNDWHSTPPPSLFGLKYMRGAFTS